MFGFRSGSTAAAVARASVVTVASILFVDETVVYQPLATPLLYLYEYRYD